MSNDELQRCLQQIAYNGKAFLELMKSSRNSELTVLANSADIHRLHISQGKYQVYDKLIKMIETSIEDNRHGG